MADRTLETTVVQFRNDSRGVIAIPRLAARAHLEGAVASWSRVEPDGLVDVDCVDGVPVNPSLRIAVAAGALVPADSPAKPAAKSRRTRSIS